MEMEKLTIKSVKANSWFADEVSIEKSLYDKDIKSGLKDNGYVWASTYLEIFLEGVFTMKPTPSVVEVNIPNGVFRMTMLKKGGEVVWLVRNDAFNCIAEVKPKDLFKWAVKNYPNGIDAEGYHILAYNLLATGCKDEDENSRIWDSTFYVEKENA